MAIQDISNLAISASFQQLLQISGSTIGTATGSQVDELTITSSHAIQADIASIANQATTAINADTASIALNADNAISSSHALQADNATSASFAQTASFALNVPVVDTGSLLLTASISDATITFEKADASTFDLTVNNVVSASHALSADSAISSSHAINADSAISASRAISAAHSDTTQEVVINVKNTSGGIIAKGTPLYATGVTGENINVSPASNTSAATMPAIAVSQVQIATNATGEATVTGRIIGVDTDGFTAGRNIYVHNGNFTQTKPTGSALIQNIGVVGKVDATDGEIVIQGSGRSNDLPNIAEDHLWVGNADGVAAATNKDALTVGTASLALDVISSANLNVTSITASFATFNSASIGYLESITGSAKIIGDAFIVVNNDTPNERYAGLAVYDSGSANNTSSFAYDGLTDDWFFEKDVTGSAHFGVALFGPEYATKGAPAYITQDRIPKGVGDHHLEDSNISDDGTTIVLGSNTEITGSLGVTGTINGSITNAISSSHAVNADIATTANTASYVAGANVDGTVATATSASHALNSDAAISSSHALQADTAISASHALIADNAPVINSLTYPTSDGTDGQAIVTDGLGVLTFQDIAGDPAGATDTGTTLSFDNAIGTIYNTAATGATGNITLSTTNAVVGAAAVIFHEDTAEPTVSGMTIDKKLGSYDTSALNVITFVHLGNNHVLQTIAGADITGIVTNSTDTYTSVAEVQHIITLTTAEYAAIATPDANTFYIVT
jgi:hypothetical protein